MNHTTTTTTTDLEYSDFKPSNKSSFILKPVLGSMFAFTSSLPNDYNVNPPALVPRDDIIKQRSTLARVSNEDVNTVKNTNKLPFISNIYIASLTVVGLFILFRFVQKHP